MPKEFLKEDIKRITKIVTFLKDYWSILVVFKGAAWFVYWSAINWHEWQDHKVDAVLQEKRIESLETVVEDLKFMVRKLEKSDETTSDHIDILGRSYAHLTNIVQTETE